MQVYFENFPKKRNSTAFPAEFGIEKDCELKETTSLLNPVLIVSDFSPVSINYAYIPSFSRYYFVDDWTYNRGYWECSLSVDVLATYKTEIGESTQYIARSSYAYDGTIVDALYPLTSDVAVDYSAINIWAQRLDLGRYVLGIINSDSNNQGGISYYVFTPTQFNALSQYLLNSPDWLNVTDISDNLTKILFNPMDYIVSAIWLPFEPSGMLVTQIKFGWWTIDNISCYKLTARNYETAIDLTIKRHPLSSSKGTYLQISPYTRYTLYAAPWGTFELDSTKLLLSNTLRVIPRIDCITGVGILDVINFAPTASITLMSLKTQFGVQVQIASNRQTLNDFSNITTGVLTSAQSFFTGNIAGVVGGYANSVGSITNAMAGTPSTVGGNGTIGDFKSGFMLESLFSNYTTESNADFGRPLCKRRIIKNTPGYILCQDAHLELSATTTEVEKIISYMTTGFFYE